MLALRARVKTTRQQYKLIQAGVPTVVGTPAFFLVPGDMVVKVLPVLDVKGGQVVRGVAGRRECYRPISSQLTPSSDPLAVARAFQQHLGLRELYLADLDAIAGSPPALSLYSALQEVGCSLWVDAGLRRANQADDLVAVGVERVVAGLETLSGPEDLGQLCDRHGERVVFSLDLKDGQPLGNVAAWEEADAWSIASHAVTLGVKFLLALDLACVGVDRGTGTEELCARLLRAHVSLHLLAGGGIRDSTDLRRLQQAGLYGVLVASALHDGRVTRNDLEQL